MSLSLDQLRAAFKTPENNNSGNKLPNNYYPFWNMQEGETCTIRFLPDSDADNPLGFMVEKIMHNLVINGERKSVPCLSMYGEDCPICKVSQEYYKADDKENGKRYWKKKQHIAQAIVVEDPLPADKETGENHEGQVRLVSLGFQLFNIIKEAFESGELEEIPYSYEGGTDFIIKKTKKGEYAAYDLGSKFARRSSDLSEDVVANLDLFTLKEVLPKHPGREKIEAMLEADLSGGTYEEGSTQSSTPAASQSRPTQTKSAPADDAPWEKDEVAAKPTPTKVETAPVSDDDDDDEAARIIAQIRARKNAEG
jgi:hypothetical protein